MENIKRRGRTEPASLRDEEERYKWQGENSEKENREKAAAAAVAVGAPRPKDPTGSTAEDVSTLLSSWSRPPTASASLGSEGARGKLKKRNRDATICISLTSW